MKNAINVVYNKMYTRTSLGYFSKSLAIVLGVLPIIVLLFLAMASLI